MRRRIVAQPLWETQVQRTIRKIKDRSESRFLKSSDVYECICIHIGDHLKKRVLSYATIALHYRHLNLFWAWLKQTQTVDIRNIDTSCVRRHFSYLVQTRRYKNSSLRILQAVLVRFFRSMQRRRLIGINPVKDFRIRIKNENNIQSIPSPFDLMRLLRGVKEHYRCRLDRGSDDRYSLFIHRRDLCIFALCIACGLRRSEIHRIGMNDIDFDKKTIRIAGKGNGIFTTRERLAFFSHPFLQEILRTYRLMRKQLPGAFFFCNWLGDGVEAKTIDAVFGTYNSFVHPPVLYSPTSLRKSFCTHLVHKKVNLSAIQHLMGHEKCDTTLTYYVQLSDAELQKTWKETNPYGNRS